MMNDGGKTEGNETERTRTSQGRNLTIFWLVLRDVFKQNFVVKQVTNLCLSATWYPQTAVETYLRGLLTGRNTWDDSPLTIW